MIPSLHTATMCARNALLPRGHLVWTHPHCEAIESTTVQDLTKTVATSIHIILHLPDSYLTRPHRAFTVLKLMAVSHLLIHIRQLNTYLLNMPCAYLSFSFFKTNMCMRHKRGP